MEIKNIKDAVAFDVEGITKYMNEELRKKFDLALPVYNKIIEIQQGRRKPTLYIQLMTFEIVKRILTAEDVILLNNHKLRCKVVSVELSPYHGPYATAPFYTFMKFVGQDDHKAFPIGLTTIANEFKFDLLSRDKQIKFNRYFTLINQSNAQDFINFLLSPFEQIFRQYQREKYIIYKKNNLLNTENITGDRKPKVVTKKDPEARKKYEESKQDVVNAFNTYLTNDEKKILMNWLNQHVNTLRLYVLKGGVYDELLSKEFPDDKYGVKRRTNPNDTEKGSSDYCIGYVGVDSLKNCPVDLFRRIARKKDNKDVFKQIGNQYRFNSYGFVLYLLSEFNDIGYITGVSNLKNRIKID